MILRTFARGRERRSKKVHAVCVVKHAMLTSAADTATYTHGRLANGVAFLDVAEGSAHVSDDDLCCVAVSFPVGSVHGEVDGLAHFLEHMLFLGNDSYPDPACFGKFMRECSGYHNAATYPDATVYIFSVPTSMASDLMVRLGHFFATPLFEQRSLDSEVAVVQEEFNRMLSSSSALESLALHHLSDRPSAPCARLKCGTTATLRHGDVRPQMVRLFDLYRPQAMFVVVQHNGSVNVRDALAPLADLPPHPRGHRDEDYRVDPTLPYRAGAHVLLSHDCPESAQLSLVWHAPARPASVSLLAFLEHALNKRCAGSLAASVVEGGFALEAFASSSLLGPVVEFSVTATLPEEGAGSSLESALVLAQQLLHHVHRCIRATGAAEYEAFVNRAREYKRVACPMRGTERVSTLALNWWRVPEQLRDHMLLAFPLTPFEAPAAARVFRETFDGGCVLVHRARSAASGEARSDPHTAARFTQRRLGADEVRGLRRPLSDAMAGTASLLPYPFPQRTVVLRSHPRSPLAHAPCGAMVCEGVVQTASSADAGAVRFPNPLSCAVVLKALTFASSVSAEGVALFTIVMQCVEHALRALLDECNDLGAHISVRCVDAGLVLSCIGPPQAVVALLTSVFDTLALFARRGIPPATWGVCAARVCASYEEATKSATDCFNRSQRRFCPAWPGAMEVAIAARACDGVDGRRAAGELTTCAVRVHTMGHLRVSQLAKVLRGRSGRVMEPRRNFLLEDATVTEVPTACRVENVVVGYGWELGRLDASRRVACAVLLQSWLSGWLFDDLRTQKSLCYACGASLLRGGVMYRLTCVVQSHARGRVELVSAIRDSIDSFLRGMPGQQGFFTHLRESTAAAFHRPRDTLRTLLSDVEDRMADGSNDFASREVVGEALVRLGWDEFRDFSTDVLTRAGAVTACRGAPPSV